MNQRRNFIKTVAATAGSFTLSELATAGSTDVLPAVTSLLLNDDSDVIQCQQVSCNNVGASLDTKFAANSSDLVFEIETPGGTRLVNEAVARTASGNCNEWRLSNSNGLVNGQQFINLSGSTINPGRYQLFARATQADRPEFSISVRACGVNAFDKLNVTLAANESKLIGSFNVSSGGTPTVRALEVNKPSSPCQNVTSSNRISVNLVANNGDRPALVLRTPDGTRLFASISQLGPVTSLCNSWSRVLNTALGDNANLTISTGQTSVSPGRYRIFADDVVDLTPGSAATTTINMSVSAGGEIFLLGNTGIQFTIGRQRTLGSLNLSSGGTPTVRLLGQIINPVIT